MAAWRSRRRRGGRGQALVEFALVLPFFLTVVFGIIVLGLAVFYQQQLANAAREAARYAAVHSATSQCPTVSWLDPTLANQPDSYYRCDAPQDGWPRLSAAGRKAVFGLAPSSVHIRACWAGYHDALGNYDAPAVDPGSGLANTFVDCTIGGTNALTAGDSLPCPPPATTVTDDTASDLAKFGREVNRVVVFACMNWSPPLAGFLLMPSSITLRAVVTETVHRQQ